MQTGTSNVGFRKSRDRGFRRQQIKNRRSRYCLSIVLPLLLAMATGQAQGSDQGFSVQGVVVSAEGAPVPGAKLRWYELSTPEGRTDVSYEELSTEPLLRADARGRFQLDGVTGGHIVVLAEAEDHAQSVHHHFTLVAGQQPMDLGSLELRPGHALVGRLVGRRVAGVQLELTGGGQGPRGSWHTHSDAQGRFRFTDIPKGRDYSLGVVPNGSSSVARVETLEIPSRSPIELRVPDGVSLLGRVLGPEGEPLDNAKIRVRSSPALEAPDGPTNPLTSDHTKTDTGGRFDLAGIAPGRITLIVEHRDYAAFVALDEELEANEERGPLELSMTRGTMLDVLVLGPNGEPASGATLFPMQSSELGFRDSSPIVGRPVNTHRDGRAKLFLHPRINQLRANHRGLGRATVDLDLGSTRSLQIKLQRDRMLTGRVFSARGKSAWNARIELQSENRARRNHSDYRGFYRFEDLEPGTYELKIELPDHRVLQQQVQVPAEGLGPIEHRLQAAPRVVHEPRSALLLSVPGLPPAERAHLEITAWSKSTWTTRSAILDGQDFLITNLQPGDWHLVLMLRGTGYWRSQDVTLHKGAGPTRVSIPFVDRGNTLIGKVSLNGAPPERKSSHTRLRVGKELGARSIEVLVQPDGSFRVPYLEARDYQLELIYPWGIEVREVWVAGETEMELAMRSHPLIGRVRAGHPGAEVAGVEVQALVPRDGGRRTRITTHSDARGQFSFAQLQPGITLLQVQTGPAISKPLAVQIGPDLGAVTLTLEPPQSVELRLPPPAPGSAEAAMAMRAIDRQGNLFRKCKLAEVQSTSIRVNDLPAGEWRLLVNRGFEQAIVPVQVPGPAVDVHFPKAPEVDLRVPALRTEQGIGDVVERPLGAVLWHRVAQDDDEPWQRQLHPPVMRMRSERYAGSVVGLTEGLWRPEMVLLYGRRIVGKPVRLQWGEKLELVIEE